MAYQYKTVGGPERGRRERGARRVADRVAAAMQEIIDAETADGWEYMRTDLVAVEEKRGMLARRQTMHCPVLVFRRALPGTEPARPVAAPGPAQAAGEAPRQAPAAPQAQAPADGPGEGPLLLGVAVGQRVAAPATGGVPAPAAPGGGAAPSRSTGTGRTLYLRRDGRHSTDG